MSTESTSAEDADDLEESDVDVNETQAGDKTLKRWFVPDRFEVGIESLEVVERPGIEPGDHDQKQAHFEGEDGEADGQEAALPALWRC